MQPPNPRSCMQLKFLAGDNLKNTWKFCNEKHMIMNTKKDLSSKLLMAAKVTCEYIKCKMLHKIKHRQKHSTHAMEQSCLHALKPLQYISFKKEDALHMMPTIIHPISASHFTHPFSKRGIICIWNQLCGEKNNETIKQALLDFTQVFRLKVDGKNTKRTSFHA
jgi:hypothetical protein